MDADRINLRELAAAIRELFLPEAMDFSDQLETVSPG